MNEAFSELMTLLILTPLCQGLKWCFRKVIYYCCRFCKKRKHNRGSAKLDKSGSSSEGKKKKRRRGKRKRISNEEETEKMTVEDMKRLSANITYEGSSSDSSIEDLEKENAMSIPVHSLKWSGGSSSMTSASSKETSIQAVSGMSTVKEPAEIISCSGKSSSAQYENDNSIHCYSPQEPSHGESSFTTSSSSKEASVLAASEMSTMKEPSEVNPSPWISSPVESEEEDFTHLHTPQEPFSGEPSLAPSSSTVASVPADSGVQTVKEPSHVNPSPEISSTDQCKREDSSKQQCTPQEPSQGESLPMMSSSLNGTSFPADSDVSSMKVPSEVCPFSSGSSEKDVSSPQQCYPQEPSLGESPPMTPSFSKGPSVQVASDVSPVKEQSEVSRTRGRSSPDLCEKDVRSPQQCSPQGPSLGDSPPMTPVTLDASTVREQSEISPSPGRSSPDRCEKDVSSPQQCSPQELSLGDSPPMNPSSSKGPSVQAASDVSTVKEQSEISPSPGRSSPVHLETEGSTSHDIHEEPPPRKSKADFFPSYFS